jgi:hypothetical protein
MSARTFILCGIAAGGLVLAACAEREQTANLRGSDTVAWQGVENPYAAPGWKAGDRTSWEEQIRTRAQAQNEYYRVH